jgi:hypothetical protein
MTLDPDRLSVVSVSSAINFAATFLNKVSTGTTSSTKFGFFTPEDQSKMQMRYSLASRANELLAMNKMRLRAAVGLLRGHTTLRAHLYKLGHAEQQECRLCGYDKEDIVHTVCDCSVLARKRYRIWGSMFLKPEDLEKVRMSSLLSLVANTGLGLVSEPYEQARECNGPLLI